MSVDQSESALCDGLTEELSNWLAHIPTLQVVARTSAFAFKGQNIDVRKIAAELGASHVLEGSLRRSGDQLRITVQLIAADTGLHIWSRSFDKPIGDIFEIEDTVSRAVAEQLHLELTADTAELWAQRQPETMEAHELYLLGRARQSRRTADDNLKSVEYFRRAVQADPQYVPALVGLSESLLNGISLNRAPIEDVKAEAEPLINRAMQINPDLPEVLAVKGWLLNEEFRSEEALPLLLRATKLNPNDASSHRFLGDLYDRLAQPGEAIKHFSAAARLDPMDFISHVFRCMELVDLGEYTEATAACTRARELDPTHMWGPLATSWIARAQGKTDEAMQWIDAARKLQPQDTYLADQKIDLLLAQEKFADARAVMRELPPDQGLFALARESNIVYAESGGSAVKAWMAEHDAKSQGRHWSGAHRTRAHAAHLRRSGDGARHAGPCRTRVAAVERGHVRWWPDPP